MKLNGFVFFICTLYVAGCSQVPVPEPVGPLPSERHLAWHPLEYYAFVHFNMNTFTNMEWGMGSEKPEWFNPTELDTRQWAKVCKDAGMKGIILTAKHHDGFCLWPSAYTEHSVKNSPWRDGKGDVVRELADACKEYGLKMGVYLSPWDRNHADYGKPEYITYFRNQLRELLTNYGEVFEVWFDGANGGTGWYGGADEERRIDQKTYYDWDNTWKIVRELQPGAVMFSDAGPDIRWVGNEQGWARPTNWSLLKRDDFAPGVVDNIEHLRAGQEDGTHWLPAEVDVSIRPGWYYHPSEDHRVKTLPQLLDIWYHSVGRNASLLLNFPVDTRGLVHEKDVEQVMKLANALKADFATDLASGKPVVATHVRGDSRKFRASNATDNNPETYWSTDDGVTNASITVDFGQPEHVNRLLVQEYIPLGQRVKSFTAEAMVNGNWQTVAEETTIGYKRILRFPTVEASQVRLTITDAKACPLISNLQLFNAPKVLEPPVITRNKEGKVTISVYDDELGVYYTTGNSEPGDSSTPYESSFMLDGKGTVKAVAIDKISGLKSPVTIESFDIASSKWNLMGKAGENPGSTAIFDGNINTGVVFPGSLPAALEIDLGEMVTLTGFSYLPHQGRGNPGIVVGYEFFVSSNGRDWGTPVAKGEFSNIQNSPVVQQVNFNPVEGKYVRFRALSTVGGQERIGIGEFGLSTK
jgi:alpha-L-fucosidase